MGRSTRRGLGMGLSALLGEAPSEAAPEGPVQQVPISYLEPSPLQPRRRFDEAEIEALAASIREHGVLQPLLVRPARALASGYEIVAGERRWRAAQRAGLSELPVVVRTLEDREVLEVALVENLQREELHPLEEARAYRRLVEEFGRRQEDIARMVGKSRSHVANSLRLLQLPEQVQTHLWHGRLSAGHARALLAADDPAAAAEVVLARGLSVRETERLVQRAKTRTPARRPAAEADADARRFADHLTRRLGLPVAIRPRRKGGELVIRYSDLDQLEDLCRRLLK